VSSLGVACFAVSFFIIANLGLGLSGCGGRNNGATLGERVIPLGQKVPKGGGYYQVGKPYQIAGVRYQPREDPGYDRVGSASWYGELFHGRRTANGEIYDMDRISAAHPTLPLPVYARVTNLNNGRTIVVRINDRGPYANDRIIDLSRRSAELLGFRNHGTATVRVKYLGRAPLSGDDSYERKYLANQSWLQFAAKGKTRNLALSSIAAQATLPAETPENLAQPWQAVVPRAAAAPADPAVAGSKATAKTVQPPPPQITGSIPRNAKTEKPAAGLVIQAGSFKSKDNADRARNVLAAIAPVDVTPVEVGAETYFRVRVGPFAAASEAKAALVKVTGAGYRGAKLVRTN
jgi:rare lipoprotein A